MTRFLLLFILVAMPFLLRSQDVQIEQLKTDNTAENVVVRKSDGTLAQRSISSLALPFKVSLTGDTLYQGSDNYVIIPGISIANRQVASYKVTFDAVWSAATHPTDFPAGAHFSPLIGMSHNADGKLFDMVSLASAGIKNMAETGSTSPLSSEIDAIVTTGDAHTRINGSGLGSPASTSINFEVTNAHSLVSIVSMIAPSPDWFIGVRDINLIQDCKWVESLTVDVVTYDSGTDDGSTFNSADAPSIPAVPVFMITTLPLGTNGIVPALGTMTFERIPN